LFAEEGTINMDSIAGRHRIIDNSDSGGRRESNVSFKDAAAVKIEEIVEEEEEVEVEVVDEVVVEEKKVKPNNLVVNTTPTTMSTTTTTTTPTINNNNSNNFLSSPGDISTLSADAGSQDSQTVFGERLEGIEQQLARLVAVMGPPSSPSLQERIQEQRHTAPLASPESILAEEQVKATEMLREEIEALKRRLEWEEGEGKQKGTKKKKKRRSWWRRLFSCGIGGGGRKKGGDEGDNDSVIAKTRE